MPKNLRHDFYCPNCGAKADFANPMFVSRYSVRRLELKIFLCSRCRLIYIDKPVAKKTIRDWREGGGFFKPIPLKSLYREFLQELEDMLNTYWIPRLGYKRAKFLKRPPAQPLAD